MKRQLILMLLTLLWAADISAKFVQEVELRDGTILIGYIYKQTPGQAIVFHADFARKDPHAKYLQHDHNYTIVWKDLKYVRLSATQDTSWYIDKLTLTDGTVYKGHIMQQEIGVATTIECSNGKTIVVKAGDLRISEKIKSDIDHDLWIDRPYTNCLRLNDGSVHEGLIVLQYTGQESSDSYVELLHRSGMRERIYLLDIKEFIITLK